MARFLFTARGHQAPSIQADPEQVGGVRAAWEGGSLRLTWGDPTLPDPVRATQTSAVTRSTLTADRVTGTVEIQVDRFGLFPAVVAADRNSIRIASDLATLLEAEPDLARTIDETALVHLLAFGQQLGTETPWHDVIHLPARARFVWRPGAGATLNLDEPTALPSIPTRPVDALDALVEAVRRRITQRPDTMIPLSGGLDSRLLLACASATGSRPDTLCYGAANSADRAIAAALAAAAGCRHDGGDIPETLRDHEVTAVARLGGGEVPIHHGHAVPGAAILPETLCRPVLTGTGSETFRAFYYDRGLPGMSVLGKANPGSRLAGRAIRWAMEHFSGDRLDLLAQHEPTLAENLRHDLEARLERILHAGPDLARGLDAVYLDLRVGRFVTAGQQLLNRLHARMHPFLDPEVVAALSGLPVGWKLGARFHRWAIERLAPNLAAVPWDKTGRPLSSGLRLSERWPGLATRLGLEGRYAKAGMPIVDYAAWARTVDRRATARRVLGRAALPREREKALAAWIDTLEPVRAVGTLTALDRATAPIMLEAERTPA